MRPGSWVDAAREASVSPQDKAFLSPCTCCDNEGDVWEIVTS